MCTILCLTKLGYYTILCLWWIYQAQRRSPLHNFSQKIFIDHLLWQFRPFFLTCWSENPRLGPNPSVEFHFSNSRKTADNTNLLCVKTRTPIGNHFCDNLLVTRSMPIETLVGLCLHSTATQSRVTSSVTSQYDS